MVDLFSSRSALAVLLLVVSTVVSCAPGAESNEDAVPGAAAGSRRGVNSAEAGSPVESKSGEPMSAPDDSELSAADVVLERADLFGICGETGVACVTVADGDGRSVRFAYLAGRDEDRGPMIFLGGGPGIDFTRLAGFDPVSFLGGEHPIVVVGEPNSDASLTEECNLAAASFGRDVVEALGGGGADESAAELVESCGQIIAASQWSVSLIEELLAEIASVAGEKVSQVVAYSFGSRLLEAFVAVDPNGSIANSERFVFASPAPVGEYAGADLIERRSADVAELMEQEEVELCPSPGCLTSEAGAVDPVVAAALIAASYALEANDPYLQALSQLGSEHPAVTEASADLARGLVFADDEGNVDPHLLRYLSIQCSAYRQWEGAKASSGSQPFVGLLERLHAPCQQLSTQIDPLPRLEAGESLKAPSICIGYSADDPIVGAFGAASIAELVSGTGVVFEPFSVGVGHYPDLVHAELKGHHEDQCGM